jgi:hypothetical protein
MATGDGTTRAVRFHFSIPVPVNVVADRALRLACQPLICVSRIVDMMQCLLNVRLPLLKSCDNCVESTAT